MSVFVSDLAYNPAYESLFGGIRAADVGSMNMTLMPTTPEETMALTMCLSSVSDPHQCKMEMLWNWYSIDTCFLTNQWHVHTKKAFAGTCIGYFFWVIVFVWFLRVSREYTKEVIADKWSEKSTDTAESTISTGTFAPLVAVLKHQWLFKSSSTDLGGNPQVYPTFGEHAIRTGFYVIEWLISWFIMMMWMYFNGYINITYLIAFVVGSLLFRNTPLSVV